MRRPLSWGLVCAVAAAVSCASAAEPVRRKSLERRAAVERLLDQPLDWDLKDRDSITLKEFTEHVRQHHGLSIRWDAATFLMLQGGGESLLGFGTRRASPSATAYLPSGYAPSVCPPGMECPPPLPAGPPATFAEPYTNLSYAGPQNVKPAAATVALPPAVKPQPSPLAEAPAAVPAALPADPLVEAVPAASAAKPSEKSPAPKAVPAPALVPVSPDDQPLTPPIAEDAKSQPAADKEGESSPDEAPPHEQFAKMPIALSALSLEDATIEEALQQMLDAVMPPMGDLAGETLGVPIVTRAMTLDYLIEGNSVLITTHLRANSRKETRVYRIGHLKNLPPEALARVITHSVRPWSWRTQATEIAERLASRWPKGDFLSLPIGGIDGVPLMDTIKLTVGQATGGVQPAGGIAPVVPAPAGKDATDEAVAATGQLLAGGAVATVQSIVAALEIVHHGDPPTGVIETLPGMLIVTQSQGAHREIADLLEELSTTPPDQGGALDPRGE